MCRLCQRRVVDLDPLTDAERVAFLAACEIQVCVTYKLRPVIAAAMTAAALGAPFSAAAQDTDVEAILVVGGMIEPAQIEFISTDETLPELEVVHERERAEPSAEDVEEPAPEE